MKEKTLGQMAFEAYWVTGGHTTQPNWDAMHHHDKAAWQAGIAAVVAEHERRKWRPMAACPACGEEIIAGYRDGGEWVQTMGDSATLQTLPEYTHWQYAPEGPK